MDILIAVLDGVMMAVYFNGIAAIFLLVNRRTFSPAILMLFRKKSQSLSHQNNAV